ncbi:glycerate kinase [[Phormidium] sp. ETS-05]|uniref:glycerate kinase n=1 Tax=[Phormidium] sp. ETS-05 TaxID=222819 RepID=UPI001E458426|nr:glycerate kinase [[Phormidium] sp. ETS-05]
MLRDLSLGEILQQWATGEQLTEPMWEQLLAWERAAVGWAVPNTEPVTNQLLDRALPTLPIRLQHLNETISHPHFNKIIPKFNLSEPNRATQTTLETLWRLWLPLAEHLAKQQQNLGRPFVQGILGGQGTGKTTLARMVQLILSQRQPKLRTVCISIDDLYKTYAERQQLLEVDPRLIWRGPPGTHDVDLGVAVLDALRGGDSPVAIPRFDKSAWGGAGDRMAPEMVESADIVLFEGWLVGVQPVPDAAFDNPPEPIITRDDIAFARDMNRKLQDYLPLWERLDSLMVLYPVDWRLSLPWRQEAERERVASGAGGMTDAQIADFVKYFWKALHPELFITPLLAGGADLVVRIKADRSLDGIYSPKTALTPGP